jgi:hypothetical protein
VARSQVQWGRCSLCIIRQVGEGGDFWLSFDCIKARSASILMTSQIFMQALYAHAAGRQFKKVGCTADFKRGI